MSDKSGGKHDSGATNHSSTSGTGGKHSRQQDKPDGWPAGTRLQGKHHPDGWSGQR